MMNIAILTSNLEGAPSEFQLLPYGEIEVEGMGKLIVDEKAINSIISHITL